jgi:hypothetical protein
MAAACCMTAEAALAQANVAAPSAESNLVTKPIWAQILSNESLNEFYPDRARRMAITGFSIVECLVNDAGSLEKCSLVAEEPKKEGFGFALLKIPHFLKVGANDETGQRTVNRPIKLGAQFGQLKGQKDGDGAQAYGLNLYVVGD